MFDQLTETKSPSFTKTQFVTTNDRHNYAISANDASADLAINPWTPWEHLSNDVPSMIDAMSRVLRAQPLSDYARTTICAAAQEFNSPDSIEKARTRAKIAYFLVTSFKG
jgi:hypothetical protein